MLDIQFIRENPDLVQKKSEDKGYAVDIKQLLEVDARRRQDLTKIEELRAQRNQLNDTMKGAKPSEDQLAQGRSIKEQLTKLEERLKDTEVDFWPLLKKVPNMPHDDVPFGKSEDDNVVAKVVGEIPTFDFEPKNHFEIAETKGWLDKDRAAKVSGARFAYIKGDMVKLQLAIEQFVIDTLTSEDKIREIAEGAGLNISTTPFVAVLPPLLIKTESYDQMDRLEPRDDRYKIEGEELWLQGSAEHVLGSMYAGEIFEEAALPVRYLGFATSFRKEAGTYGKDMEGIIRMHQFDKLEMESFTTLADGYKEHLMMIAIQEYLLASLNIPYHVLLKCTADIGKPDARGVDMEAWLPAQAKYRETHTADYMTDYQSRRLQTRVRTGSGIELVCTNDATAFALGRAMVVIIENYQTKEGDVIIPKILQPYMGGRERI